MVGRVDSNPAARTFASVSRLGWQPPLTHVHSGWMKSCQRAPNRLVDRTCSSIRSRPPGASTRFTSWRPRIGSGTLQNTSPLTTVSKAPSRNGSASAEARTSATPFARRRARWSESRAGSTPMTTAPAGKSGRFRPVPHPTSSTRPRAPAASFSRHERSPVASPTQSMASYSQGICSMPRTREARRC